MLQILSVLKLPVMADLSKRQDVCECLCVSAYVRMCVCACVRVPVCMDACVCECLCESACVWMHVNVFVSACVIVHVSACLHVYVYFVGVLVICELYYLNVEGDCPRVLECTGNIKELTT